MKKISNAIVISMLFLLLGVCVFALARTILLAGDEVETKTYLQLQLLGAKYDSRVVGIVAAAIFLFALFIKQQTIAKICAFFGVVFALFASLGFFLF